MHIRLRFSYRYRLTPQREWRPQHCPCHDVHAVDFLNDELKLMNILPRAMLLMSICGTALLAQSGSPGTQQLFSARSDVVGTGKSKPSAGATFYYSPALLPATSDTAWLLKSSTYKHAAFSRLNLLPAHSDNTWAISAVPHSLPYKFSDDSPESLPIKFGPLRYTFRPRTSRFDRPAGGRFQRLVDGFLRHYTSGPTLPGNVRCMRALSCTSLYEQALRQRAAHTEY